MNRELNLIKLLNNKFYTIFLIPFLLGAITIFGFPPYNFSLVNFFSFSILLFLIFIIKKKFKLSNKIKYFNFNFFYLGSAFGFGFFLFGNYWISISLTHDEMFKYLIPFSLIFIPLFLSLFFGFVVLIVGPLAEKKIYFILIFSLVFSIFEFFRGNLFTGFPWNLMSYTWSWSIESIQILSLIGTYTLSLISITFFCSPFLFFQKVFFKKDIIFVLLLIIIFTLNYLYGLNKVNNSNYNFDEEFTVKIVSPNFSLQNYKNKSEVSILKQLIKISNPEKNKKTLFIWPEGIFYESYLQDLKLYKDLFEHQFTENHLIILGINNFINNDDFENFKYFNSLVVLNHKLDILHVYNKIKLVPFGEFLPFEKNLSKFGFKKITKGYNSFTSGDERLMINLSDKFNNKLILPLICYEIIYPSKIKNKEQFPDLIVNISEDAWFGKSIGPYQHYAKAIYRSVEEGVFIARAANKGISSFINPNGITIKSINTRVSDNIELNFPHFNKVTAFSNYGNKIFFLIILLYIFVTLIFNNKKI